MPTLISDVWNYAKTHKKLWIIPFVFLLLSVGVLIVLMETTAIGPFIYALF